MQTTYVLNFTLLPTGLPKKKEIYQKTKNKTKTLSGLQKKRKDRTHWDQTNQYNFLKIISIVLSSW